MASIASTVELRGGTEQDYVALRNIVEKWMQTYGSGDIETLDVLLRQQHSHNARRLGLFS